MYARIGKLIVVNVDPVCLIIHVPILAIVDPFCDVWRMNSLDKMLFFSRIF